MPLGNCFSVYFLIHPLEIVIMADSGVPALIAAPIKLSSEQCKARIIPLTTKVSGKWNSKAKKSGSQAGSLYLRGLRR